MTDAQILIMVGAVANIATSSVYFWRTLKGEIQPNRISLFLWAFATFITAAIAWSEGSRWTVLPVFIAGLCPTLNFLATFFNKKAYWKLGLFDYLCGVFSLVALVLWLAINEPTIACFFSVLADLLATLPVLWKIWTHPQSEEPLGYLGGIFSGLAVFFGIETGRFTELAFPVYLVIIDIIIIAEILWRAKALKKKADKPG